MVNLIYLKNKEMEITYKKLDTGIYLFKDEVSGLEYHYDKIDIEFVKSEIKKKLKILADYPKIINLKLARSLGFCDFGIKDFCTTFDILKTVTFTQKELIALFQNNQLKALKFCHNNNYEINKITNLSLIQWDEETISKNAENSFRYSKNILKGRFKLGEEAISKDTDYSYLYAKSILKGRFKLGEESISKDPWNSERYISFAR